MATAVNVSATNNAEIDGLLSGYKWTGTITYSFPDAASDYASPYSGGSSEPTTSGFASAPSQMQAAINYAIGLILGYTNANIQYAGTNGADIMVAQSPAASPTSYAYYPGNYASGGDIWFGTAYNYSLAALGNYYFTTALHELGHALGLKHSQETGGLANVAVPSAHDDSEYTVMSYRSYVGASTTSGYTNEAYGYPQTYMANDIVALQTMYGANYTTQGGTTVYTWSSTTGQEFINGVGQPADNGGAGGSANRIYQTIWDGGGVDTYDLSNYTTNLSINLNPGASSVFSSVQLANLGNGHYASGNVYNSYLYNNDGRSLIDNAIGGSGNDTIIGNAIANALNGGGGNDTITGGGGNDTIIGGAGTDTAIYSGNRSSYSILYNSATQTFTIVDQRSSSPDGTDTVTGVEYFQFADGSTIAAQSLLSDLTASFDHINGTTIIAPGGSISVDFWMVNFGSGSSPASTSGLYLSTDATITTGDVLLSTVTSLTLSSNGTAGYYDHQTVTLTLPGNLAPGTYYVGGIADYTNSVAESNEANNNHNVTQITVTGPAQPDLTASFDNVSSTSLAGGDSTTVDFWLVNFGKAAAAASTSGVYLSADATITTGDTLLTTIASPGLTANGAAGYYDHQFVTLTLPGNLVPGTYYVGGIADYTNSVAESNEANNNHNVTQITVTGPSQPDLTASFDSVSSTSVAVAGSTTIDFWLVNFGKAAAAMSTSGVYLSTDATITTSDTLLTTIASPGLTANGTAGYYDHQTVTLTLPGNLSAGTYYIGGIADYANSVTESNEANNNHSVTQITVTGPAQPDLTASFDSVSSTSLIAGGSTNVDFWLVNFGKAAAAPSVSGFYFSMDPTITTGDTLLATVSSPGLSANGTPGYYDHQTVPLTLPNNVAPGTYYIGGIADYTSAIGESNEINNNHNVTQITVVAPPSPSQPAALFHIGHDLLV
ncbi:CARDB domain-containing protein [Bradyrhizobium sp. 76]|uniref:CARDB domain-containing protein n=1 Tax=Bradyrhizobium sp. 76 TaxID=2782680 RepID=UPI001FF871E7|nr:CARDB domain-containing protein [Bradyrhizobium sp. 76]MCK1408089.1 M10 family metallopeptidase C-terminal domain-containing protein [Bradyrhizobium sp. 76]